MCHQQEFFSSQVHRQPLNLCWLFPSHPAAPARRHWGRWLRFRWLPSGSCGLVIAAPNCRGQTWWEGRVYSSSPFPKHSHCCPPPTAKQAQLELGGPSYSGLNPCFPTPCEHEHGPAGSSALQNTSRAFPGERQKPTRRGMPCPLFPCSPGQTWGNTSGLSRLEPKPLKAMRENRIEKNGAKKKDSEKREAGRKSKMFWEGVMSLSETRQTFTGAEPYPRWVWDNWPPELGMWKRRGLPGNRAAAGVSCQLCQPCQQPLSLAAQGGLSALQKFLGLVSFAVKSRGFADIIFTLHGINSQPEKQRKTPHEAHVRQNYSCTIYLLAHRSYFLPLLVRDLLCWPKVSFSSLVGRHHW